MASAARAQRRASQRASSVHGSDSIQNFVSRVGLGTANQSSAAGYGYQPFSRNRQEIENAYRGSWIARQVVDAPAEDMTRAGFEVQSQQAPEDIDKFHKAWRKLCLWQSLEKVIKWSRLYGGGIGILLIDGQNLSTPLRADTVREGSFKGILPLDRWSVQAEASEYVTENGPDLGLPKFYNIVTNYQGLPTGKVHYTRVIRLEGEDLPIYQKRSENGWGLSVLEPLWDRLLAFDSATQGTSQLVFKAHLRTMSIQNLRDLIAAGGKSLQAVVQHLDMIRMFQSNEGLTLMDSRDTFETHQYAFGGLSDVLLQLAQQLAGATQIPLVRLFGQSPAGLNATGDSDIRNYYDAILAQQENRLRRPVELLAEVLHRSLFGQPADDSFEIIFRPLWQMSEKEKVEIGKSVAETIGGLIEQQTISRATGLRELQAWSHTTGMFTNITDEEVEEAENDPPAISEADDLEEVPEPNEDESDAPIDELSARRREAA